MRGGNDGGDDGHGGAGGGGSFLDSRDTKHCAMGYDIMAIMIGMVQAVVWSSHAG